LQPGLFRDCGHLARSFAFPDACGDLPKLTDSSGFCG